MPTQTYNAMLSALDEYADIAKRQNRNEGLLRGLDMLNESLSAAMERKRRKQEKEQERADRAAEIEAQNREYDRRESGRQASAAEDKMLERDQKYVDEQAKRAQERKDKEEAKAANMPKIQSINAKFRAAIAAKDDNAFADALEEYSYLDEDFQKLVPLSAHQKRFDKVMEPPKEGGLSQSQSELVSELRKRMDSTQDPDERLGYLAMMTAVEKGEALTTVIKEMREMSGAEQGPEVPQSMRSPLNQQQQNEADEFDYEAKTADMTEAGAGLSNAFTLFGVTEVPELNEQFFEPFISPDAKRRKYEFYVAKYSTQALNDGTFDDIPDEAERRSAAKRYGIEKVQELYGKPVRSTRRVLDNTPPVDSSASIERTEDEIRRRFPRLKEALLNDAFREAIDAEYGEGWSEYLSDSQQTETPESLLEY